MPDLTIALSVYNKAHWLRGLLHSWLGNLSGQHSVEVVMTFDACRDGSDEVARRVLEEYDVSYSFAYENDVYEMRCANNALERAAGDVLVYAQDDNWIYDPNWDAILLEVVNRVPDVGVVGLLAGSIYIADDFFSPFRVECSRSRKAYLTNGKVSPLGMYRVDAVMRPFAARTDDIRAQGGMGPELKAPSSYDDTQLGLRLLREGRTNVYVPFDLVNTVSKYGTMSSDFVRDYHDINGTIVHDQYWPWLRGRRGSTNGTVLDVRVNGHGLEIV